MDRVSIEQLLNAHQASSALKKALLKELFPSNNPQGQNVFDLAVTEVMAAEDEATFVLPDQQEFDPDLTL